MKRITQTKEIQTGDNSGVIVSGNEKISYSEDFVAADFEPNELITTAAVNELIGDAVFTPAFEIIPFDPTPSAGEQTIDFTINDRSEFFPRANVRAFNVDGDIETEITGFMKQFTRSGGFITEFYTDGIMGEGYFLLTN